MNLLANTNAPGSFTVTAVAVDRAGNRATQACPYTVGIPLCNGKAPTIVGTGLANSINGTNGPDVIQALGGNDVIDGRGGNDTICGGDHRTTSAAVTATTGWTAAPARTLCAATAAGIRVSAGSCGTARARRDAGTNTSIEGRGSIVSIVRDVNRAQTNTTALRTKGVGNESFLSGRSCYPPLRAVSKRSPTRQHGGRQPRVP